MLKFLKSVKEYNKEIYQPAFNVIKMYKDELNKGDIQEFLDEYVSKLYRGRMSKVLAEGGINLFSPHENYICDNCFEGNDIISITIPKHIEIIGAYCFAYSELKEIIFSPGSKLNILGFESLAGTWIESIELPENFQHLDGSVFAGCSELKTITINKKIQSIGSRVFNQCQLLTKLNYKGTMAEWQENVYLDKKWKEGSSIEKIICTDGVIKL